MEKPVISVQDAVVIMRSAGIPASIEKVKVGLQTREYTFGNYFPAGTLLKHDVYDVYRKLLYDWLRERVDESAVTRAG